MSDPKLWSNGCVQVKKKKNNEDLNFWWNDHALRKQ